MGKSVGSQSWRLATHRLATHTACFKKIYENVQLQSRLTQGCHLPYKIKRLFAIVFIRSRGRGNLRAKLFVELFFVTVAAVAGPSHENHHDDSVRITRVRRQLEHHKWLWLLRTRECLHVQGKLKASRPFKSKLYLNSSRNILKTRKAREIKYIP